jgi:hypothetical protein
VVKHCKQKAADGENVAFCSTIVCADNIAEAFNAFGVPTILRRGDGSLASRSELALAKEWCAAESESALVANPPVVNGLVTNGVGYGGKGIGTERIDCARKR